MLYIGLDGIWHTSAMFSWIDSLRCPRRRLSKACRFIYYYQVSDPNAYHIIITLQYLHNFSLVTHVHSNWLELQCLHSDFTFKKTHVLLLFTCYCCHGTCTTQVSAHANPSTSSVSNPLCRFLNAQESGSGKCYTQRTAHLSDFDTFST